MNKSSSTSSKLLWAVLLLLLSPFIIVFGFLFISVVFMGLLWLMQRPFILFLLSVSLIWLIARKLRRR